MLKLDDGFNRGRAQFRDEVRHLQRVLRLIGIRLEADGYFGVSTQDAVKRLQKENGLVASGEVDNNTWLVIEKKLAGVVKSDVTELEAPSETVINLLQSFRGDLAWIHTREGHAGKAYWPGGHSGVTLDPGFDLGQQSKDELLKHYTHILNQTQLNACIDCIGLTGREAKSHLNKAKNLIDIRISKGQALQILPVIIDPYWVAVGKRFPHLLHATTPDSVQTALLSLAFNRGAHNRGLDVLNTPIAQGNWNECANFIGSMQQNHQLEGIRRRRRMEAALVQPSR
ncbi:pesticin C-terminus-like muramidase [Pseudoalteromonas sp. MMG012]|uniref:pesticin C-terminus-like muramidase n=1 Tax=Pseudoalteromonas sp. MMG012 TaxID=2822686 RepID=UPI001B39D88F|nr:pesticin C-terminus-like muramidase [Pseudoalteromonas sp. MMG012]MBQ4852545.1 peptidoglycan-binding protein [Pseudoalteromonas sp. MMG012]